MSQLRQFRGLYGSRAYNLHRTESDIDIHGAYIESKDQLYGLVEAPMILEAPDTKVFPFKRFGGLLQTGAVNAIETLFSPSFIANDPCFNSLFADKYQFVNMALFNQLSGMSRNMVMSTSNSPKHFSTVYRLYLVMKRYIQTGVFNVVMGGQERDSIMEFKYNRPVIQQKDCERLNDAISCLDTGNIAPPLTVEAVSAMMVKVYDAAYSEVTEKPVYTAEQLKTMLNATRRDDRIKRYVRPKSREDMTSQENKELKAVETAIGAAEKLKMTPELMWSAIKAAKEFPQLNMEKIITIAMKEWDIE